MASTRDKIIEQAKTIFAEYEYDKVSLRDIAGACGISPGNLNYYFSKKEDLVMTCMEDVYDDIFLDYALTTSDSLSTLLTHMQRLSDTSTKNLYYFKNMLTLAGSFEVAKNKQTRVREQMYYYYLRSFKILREAGLLRNDIPDSNYGNLAVHLVMLQIIWHLHNSPSYDEPFSFYSFFDSLCASLYPYLTSAGIEEWNAYFSSDKKITDDGEH